MASLGTSLMLTLISIVFMSIASHVTSNRLTDTEIKHLGSKTNNLENCYKLLKFDPRTTNVDARGLAEVSVDLTSKKANKIHSLINSFVNKIHDSRFKNIQVVFQQLQ
ncbi:hypothetical protein Sango_2857900 [Sesamum angolense]|uniref:Pectinesterase inhibitor domain-containing protein n=1 Tax=Sesamum angolense TaxID=2727404 RepID=A0AAE1W0A3_9LAMI|nr:hypothetical protein Sango_2857900 [Sesamum angolense]